MSTKSKAPEASPELLEQFDELKATFNTLSFDMSHAFGHIQGRCMQAGLQMDQDPYWHRFANSLPYLYLLAMRAVEMRGMRDEQVADIVAKWGSVLQETIEEFDAGVGLRAPMGATRHWRCPDCGQAATFGNIEEVPDGCPVCGGNRLEVLIDD